MLNKTNKIKVAVVIPIYKKILDPFEKISLKQCVKILNKYNIKLAAPKNLNLNNYFKINPDLKTEFFNPYYFKSIKGYNKLMLSQKFYNRFVNYDYILIYQLDAFVFKDELEYWCNKNYDYIGAPSFKNFITDHFKKKFWKVGNGGFSLRKIKKFLKILERLKSSTSDIKKNNSLKLLNKITRTPIIGSKILKYKNNFEYFSINPTFNEDYFWGTYAKKISSDFKVPPVKIALKFSFEKNPDYFFILNKKKLPFGCHAWYKYNLKFWKKYIKL